MADENRKAAADLKLLEQIVEKPYRFEWFGTLRFLEARYSDRPRFGHAARPLEEPVRLGQEPSLNFAPSTLAKVIARENDAGWIVRGFHLGLFGPNGPLPLHLTEYASQRWRWHKDETFPRFVDMFQHRFLTFFYRAWASSNPAVQFDRPDEDRFSFYLGSLFGLGFESQKNRDALPDLTKLHFAGLMANQTRHAEGLRSIIGAALLVPAKIVEFVGHWLDLPAADRLRIGALGGCGRLGRDALVGARVWDRQQYFRVELGPMTLAQYQSLLPGGATLERLRAIVKNYAGFALGWEARLVLKQSEVPATKLGQLGQLGWTTWLRSRPARRDADDLVLRRGVESSTQRA